MKKPKEHLRPASEDCTHPPLAEQVRMGLDPIDHDTYRRLGRLLRNQDAHPWAGPVIGGSGSVLELLNEAVMGIASEAGELVGEVRALTYQHHNPKKPGIAQMQRGKVPTLAEAEVSEEARQRIALELGDVLFYVNYILDALDLDLGLVMAQNLAKLRQRNLARWQERFGETEEDVLAWHKTFKHLIESGFDVRHLEDGVVQVLGTPDVDLKVLLTLIPLSNRADRDQSVPSGSRAYALPPGVKRRWIDAVSPKQALDAALFAYQETIRALHG